MSKFLIILVLVVFCSATALADERKHKNRASHRSAAPTVQPVQHPYPKRGGVAAWQILGKTNSAHGQNSPYRRECESMYTGGSGYAVVYSCRHR